MLTNNLAKVALPQLQRIVPLCNSQWQATTCSVDNPPEFEIPRHQLDLS
jgi:hypothetical protein